MALLLGHENNEMKQFLIRTSNDDYDIQIIPNTKLSDAISKNPNIIENVFNDYVTVKSDGKIVDKEGNQVGGKRKSKKTVQKKRKTSKK
jgi:hypothetical protein